jgi:hypothetical protein
LLILAGNADRPADAVERVQRLALGVQDLALPAPEAPRPQDGHDLVQLVGLGNRRKAQNLHGSCSRT